MKPSALLLIAAMLTLASPALADEGDAAVKVDAATQKKIGVVLAPLAAAHRQGAATDGFARVLDPGPLAALDADIAAAAAGAEASAAEAARTKALFAADATVSAKTAEAATAQARADQIKLTMLRRRLGLEWGPGLTRLNDAARGRLIAALASGQAALLRVDAAQMPPGVRGVTLDLGPSGLVNAVVLGPARTSDTRLQSTGLIVQVTGRAAAQLGAGLTVPVRISAGAAANGVVLPRSALLRVEGHTVVYVRKDAESFEQRVAENGVSDPAGLFVATGFRPGEAVAVQGGMAIYAAQNPPAAEE
jgi:hypothetical protein